MLKDTYEVERTVSHMKMQIIIQGNCCKEYGNPESVFSHNKETGEPQLTCAGCAVVTPMTKQDRVDLLNRLNRASNTLSRHLIR